MNNIMQEVCKKDLKAIANELVNVWKVDPLKVTYLYSLNCKSKLQEMLCEKITWNKIAISTGK
jgi:hypothetical protein